MAADGVRRSCSTSTLNEPWWESLIFSGGPHAAFFCGVVVLCGYFADP
jgi:hypothetical protein